MATFVIVHGSWGGGWEWDGVAERLSAKGHRVSAPTLTGVGEPTTDASPAVRLETHVEDVLGAIRSGPSDDALLVGHSYGGAVATVAASRVPDLLRALIYVDGFVPSDGQSVVDLLDPEWAEAALFEPARTVGGGWRVPFPFPDDLDDYPGAVAERYAAGWHPLATLTDPAAVHDRIAEVRRYFVHCVRKEPGEDAFLGAERTARDAGWPVLEIHSGHDVQIEDPDGIAALLDEIARDG
jgi:pimeloyl-ACP methyl ester carboxylesterase